MIDATIRDGSLRQGDLQPPRSNWTRAIADHRSSPGPLTGAIADTFGGLATGTKASALRSGIAVSGLYAAAEITGRFYGAASNAVSALRAFASGRIAGLEAVAALAAAKK